MATKVEGITDDDDDDEISILHSPPAAFMSGATKAAAIITIDLTQDDDVEILPSSTKGKGLLVYKGDDTVFLRSFACEICTDDKPISDSFRIIGCDHRYCTQCISNFVAAKLQENITRINCPAPRCGGFLEPHHCRTILPKAVFERWGDALCEAMILGEEKFYCPFEDCSALLIDDRRERLTQSECPQCRRLFCAACKAAWHSGIECRDFQKLRADERSTEDIMVMNLAENSKWIRCPKCRFYVSKSEGCKFMRCRCGTTFCYNFGVQTYDHYCNMCRH